MTKRGALAPLFGHFSSHLAPNRGIFESRFGEFLCVVDVASVDNEGVLHGLLHHAEARHAELLPFGHEEEGVCVEQCFVHVVAVGDDVAHAALAFVHGNRVIDSNYSASLCELVDKYECGRFAHVVRFQLDGEAHMAIVLPLRTPIL